MLFGRRIILLLLLAGLALGCERAKKYPPVEPKDTSRPNEEVVVRKPPPVPPHYGWLEPLPRLDIPLQFIAEDTNPAEWQALKEYWTASPSPGGVRAAGVGLPALEAAVALGTQLSVESIKIKVPRGLPDPTPLMPAANPPTYGKWILGQRLFFDDKLLKVSKDVSRSCADCHDPSQAFALNVDKPVSSNRNVPTLLNSVYNRHQFWDGRADALEQVLLRQLDDEREADKEPPPEQSPGYLHVWPGLVKRVGGRNDYLQVFEMVFGTDPTADNIAKALATYLRTLLSGDSLVDRAAHHQKQRGGAALQVEDFEPFLSDKALAQFPKSFTAKEAAQHLVRGQELFQGKARCNTCHPGPLFTDHGFHNVGIGESALFPLPGLEPGRFAVVPFGLKDRRLSGAFKTPSLRDVSRTAPYMHDGSLPTLAAVLSYFNDGIPAANNLYLDPELTLELGLARKLHLGSQDLDALELFLWALRGVDVPLRLRQPAPR
jgi:cytochrome c peroxidase